MSQARDQILGGIRKGLGRGALDPASQAACDARLRGHPRNIIPKRSDLPHAEQVELFVRLVTGVAATVARLPSTSEVPEEVARFLAQHNLPPAIRVAPDPQLAGIDWSTRPMLEVSAGRARDTDLTSVTAAVAGIAESGTLLLASGAASPTTLNFMPDNHIVVLRTSQIVGPYEEAWDMLRQAGDLPRTVNFVTGPSRTGDIEQKIQLGAHGPRRLHIVLVDGAEA